MSFDLMVQFRFVPLRNCSRIFQKGEAVHNLQYYVLKMVYQQQSYQSYFPIYKLNTAILDLVNTRVIYFPLTHTKELIRV